MFPIPGILIIVFLTLLIGVVLAVGLIYGEILNLIFRRRPGENLVSGTLVGFISFAALFMALICWPARLHWINSQPQDWRTFMWDHSLIISFAFSIICISIWRFAAAKALPLR